MGGTFGLIATQGFNSRLFLPLLPSSIRAVYATIQSQTAGIADRLRR
jgi:hypothetical protein